MIASAPDPEEPRARTPRRRSRATGTIELEIGGGGAGRAWRRGDDGGGGEHWAVVATLVETCKLNGVDPHAYLADVISRIVNGHPNSRLDELLPWAYASKPDVA